MCFSTNCLNQDSVQIDISIKPSSNSFFDSYLAKFPRRTCETVFATFSLNVPSDGSRGFKENFNWEMIKEFLSDMLVEEQENDGKSNLKSKYLVWGEDVNK